jgi:site-specific recombinase XerD
MADDLIPSEIHDLARIDARPLIKHPVIVYLASLAEGSRRTIFHALDTMAEIVSDGQLDAFTLDWGALRYEHTTALRAHLAQRYKPSTANKMLSALRRVLYHAWKLGQMDTDDYRHARDVSNIRGHALPAGRDLGIGEIVALIRACEEDDSPGGVRDAAIIALMYATGIRRASVVALDIGDYDPAQGALRVRESKNNREYMAYLASGGAQRALADWMAVRGDEPGPLFWPVKRGGSMTNRRLTPQSIYNILAKRSEQAGIAPCSPHDLRRTLAGDLLDAGVDIVTVQRILGHSNVDTTARYDRRPEDAKRQAARLIHVPYRGQES